MLRVLACLCVTVLALPAAATGPGETVIGGQWFLKLSAGDVEPASRFSVDRGYINIKHRLNDRLGGRITPDISVDREGDGEGDLEMRLKYCYADWRLDDLGPLTRPHVEFGLVHRPWLDFEEHVAGYRVQGTMFLERNGIFNSADYGATFVALLGGRMPEDYRARVNSKYAGRRGSLSVGVYNGGGYHAIERNDQKTVEGRLTLRPLPEAAPGVQLTYLGVTGRANTTPVRDWTVNLWYLSWESARGVLSAQYFHGRGNSKGNVLDAAGDARDQHGASLFAELRLADRRWSLLGRYDTFDEGGADPCERVIAGVAHHLDGHTKVLLDYDREMCGDWSAPVAEVVSFGVEYAY